MIAVVDVGWTSTRPIRTDEHTSGVTVTGRDVVDCTLAALQIVACRPQCEMVTSHHVRSITR